MNAIEDLIWRIRYHEETPGTVAAENLAQLAEKELAELYREIDNYDRICTKVRNELTAAGIPELTDDRLHFYALATRVSQLCDSHKKLEAELAYQEETVLPTLRTDFELALSILKRLAYKKSASDVDYLDLVAATRFVDDHTEPMR